MAFMDNVDLDKINEMAKNVSDMIGELAKNVGEKAGDMLEIGKLSAKIGSSNSTIEELKAHLGDHYYSLFLEGQQLDDDAVVLCNTIKEYVDEVDMLRAKLEEMKANTFTRPATCPNCGASNKSGALYCKNCGAKLYEEEEEEPAAEDVEAQVTVKVCPNCKSENDPENVFCNRCGTKL